MKTDMWSIYVMTKTLVFIPNLVKGFIQTENDSLSNWVERGKREPRFNIWTPQNFHLSKFCLTKHVKANEVQYEFSRLWPDKQANILVQCLVPRFLVLLRFSHYKAKLGIWWIVSRFRNQIKKRFVLESDTLHFFSDPLDCFELNKQAVTTLYTSKLLQN